MKVFKDITPNSGHASILKGFKAVVASGAAIMNGRQDWALYELEIDADDWEWLYAWAESLSASVACYWLQTEIREFDEEKLKHPAAFGTLLLLHSIDYAVKGLPQPNAWPLPVKYVFPANVRSLLFDDDDEEGNDDEPGDFYLRSIILAVKKLKIKKGISVDTKRWLRETIALQISPDIANLPATPNWIAKTQAYVSEQNNLINAEPAPPVEDTDIQNVVEDDGLNINLRAKDLFTDIEPCNGAAYVEKAAQKILTSASEQGIIQRPWSLAELYPTDIDYIWLRILVKKLDANAIKYCLSHSHRFTWDDKEYPIQAALGLVLLLWISEEARRKAVEGWLWKWVPQDAFHPEVRQILFNQGNPSSSLKDAIEIAARRFNLRHVFGVEGTQQWIDTVFLQFGFTKRGMEARLPYWLAGQTATFSVRNLLAPGSGSDKFIELWNSLKTFRQGNIGIDQAINDIQDNPWILPEWAPGIASVARQVIDQEEAAEADGDIDSEIVLVSAPVFRWVPPAQPDFVCKLADLSSLGLIDDVYTVKVNGHAVDQLSRQPNGSYLLTASEEIPIFLGDPQARIQVVSEDGNVIASQIVELWMEGEDVTVFRMINGNRVGDPYKDTLSLAAAYAILTPSDLRIDPQPVSWVTVSGYRLSYMSPGWDENTKVLLDNFVIWKPVIGLPPADPPIASVITLQLENHHPQSLIRWGETIFVKATYPANTQINFVRYNGKVVNFHELTSQSGRIGPIKVEPTTSKDLLEFKIGILDDGTSIRVTKHLDVRLCGVAIQTARGWIALNDDFQLRSEAARKSKFKIKPPGNWDGVVRQISEWALMEGDLWVRKLSKNQSPIGTVNGWGAPMTLRLGPYNAVNDAMTIAKSVIHRGVISNVDFDQNQIVLNLASELEPDHRYSIVVWHKDKTVSCSNPISGGNGRQWVCQSNVAMNDVLAIGVSFEKWCLGSWWNSDWASTLANFATIDPESVAGMIRWLHLPILSPKYVDGVHQFAHQYPAEFLTAWLKSGSLGQGLQCGDLDEGWMAAVRRIFFDWDPDAANVDQIISGLSEVAALNVMVSEASWGLLKVDPRLLYKVLKNWTNTQIGIATANQIIKNIRLQIAEVNDDGSFHAKRTALISDAASEWGVNPFFIENGIVQKAIQSAQGVPITKRDEMNIALAISSETLRRLLAISLLKLIA